MTDRCTRRSFIKKAVASSIMLPAIFRSPVLGLGRAVPPSERITIGIIGTGNMGGIGTWAHTYNLLRLPDAKILALCDVKGDRRDLAKLAVDEAYGNKDCAVYGDYRELLAREDLDAVFIATPDHWHALIATDAARAGKHVYSEKPLTRTFRESQILRDVVHRSGIVFQAGTQHRSDPAIGRGCDLAQSGRLGKLNHVRLVIPSGSPTPIPAAEPVPKDLDYEMWLGPAPWAPYTTKRYAGGWYSISDYCMGQLAGWGAHHVDTAQQGSGTSHTGPVEVDGKAMFPGDGLCDTAIHWDVHVRFANGLTWDITDAQQDPAFMKKYKSNDGGVLLECEGGSVFVWRDNIVASDPAGALREPLRPSEISEKRPGNHRLNFLNAIRTGSPTTANIDVAQRSITINHLVEISTRLGRKIQWDPEKECILNDEEAARMLTRAYRAPWRLQA